jgi:hypothetical protein
VLRLLWENNMIQVFQDDKGNEYYGLLSDFTIERVFPKYLLNIIKKQYFQKSKTDDVLVEYLNVLEDTCYSLEEEPEVEQVEAEQ